MLQDAIKIKFPAQKKLKYPEKVTYYFNTKHEFTELYVLKIFVKLYS